MQTFQKVEDSEDHVYENPSDEKNPVMEPFSQSSVHKRKSSRGASFASEGKTEEKEKLKHDQDKAEEVSHDLPAVACCPPVPRTY